ncbi:MAG: molybdopterin-guanine dinucleotide biosynthesis protein B [Methanoregula sp.]|nr:molybdopterin-guanine dinucleotide biosynthesis protein B [Methanoregula sp.]MDD5187205.1 molybdopterin-guanine dinucleotide biosynthesis protein B [Methanoregula sp.]
MKIIHIVGRSNSGKTTFIRTLIPELKKLGTVAAIKHLGDHEYQLEKGKDTTGFFDAGADISVGLDADKAVLAIHNNDLDAMLDLLCTMGMAYVIIEGFKARSIPKIIIGDLASDPCVLRNPTVDQVLCSLDKFEDYYREKAEWI